MHWRGVLIVALEACSTPGSVDIEIETHDPAIKTVELFVGVEDCSACDGIAPPSSVTRPTGAVHYISDARFTAPVVDGIAGFRLQPSDQGDTHVPQLAAVGFDDRDSPSGFVVDDAGFDLKKLLGTKRRYELAAQEIAGAQGPTSAVGGDQIVAWRAPMTAENPTPAHPASCLAIERGGKAEFFVPPADPDCDGIMANECDPNWYQYTAPQNTTHACLVETMGECQVGSLSSCVDGTPHTCSSVDEVCVPHKTCEDCTSGLDQTCLETLVTDPGIVRLHCTFPVFDDITSGALTACTSTSNFVDLSTLYPGGCQVGWVALGTPSPITAINGSLDISEPGISGNAGVNGFGPPCRFAIAPAVTITATPAMPFVTHSAFAVVAPGKETLLMPFVVDYVKRANPDSCQMPTQDLTPSCQILPDTTSDGLWKCLQ